MADSNIGALPQAEQLNDDSLLVAEQQGQAVKVTGAQFKEFGRQAVIAEVQGYVDQAQAAAKEAVSSASAVTNMTVEANTLLSGKEATVKKTMEAGKVHLAFGLPRGEQGIPGPDGPPGPRGPQGPTGAGLTILGYYDTLTDLESSVAGPEPGDAYGVGLIAPYNIYVFDGVSNTWKDNGQLSGGGGGGPLPENVVTTEGGAEIDIPVSLGGGPHIITFVDEEESPLTAGDIEYSDTQTVKDAIDGLFTSVSDGKALLASAITDKGVATEQDATFQQLAENISQISTGADTSDATATSFDILSPKTAYTANGKVEGLIPTLLAQTIVPGTADKTIANGQYLGGTQTIKGDPNLTSGNIKSGVTLFGVEGALESTFQAVLTVKADVGAVVTATHSNGTKVEGLSTTGTVVLDLPLEGTWKVTAVRGAAQYNTVTIQVTSQYSAELTAEVHIEYYGSVSALSYARAFIAGATIGSHMLFAGGGGSGTIDETNIVDVYDEYYTHKNANPLSKEKSGVSGATVSRFALFGGGYEYEGTQTVDAYNESLTHSMATQLRKKKYNLAAASIENYALFGGGGNGISTSPDSSVDAYDEELTHSIPVVLAMPAYWLAASSNQAYAIFGGGYGEDYEVANVTAYDKNLTRTTPTILSEARRGLSATRAGNYVIFAGGRFKKNNRTDVTSTVDAYDLFLTRTAVEGLGQPRSSMGATTVRNVAIFAGGVSTGMSRYTFVDIYDPFLVHTTASLTVAREGLGAASIGNSALFAGGQDERLVDGAFTYLGVDSVEVFRYV